MRIWLSPLLLVALLAAPQAWGETDLDVTIRMVPEDEPVSEGVVRRIELPEGAAERAKERARQGRERAGEAASKGRDALERARERARQGLERRPGGGDLPVPGGVKGPEVSGPGGGGAPSSPDRPGSAPSERGGQR
ncbi:DUF1631 domain-containing protein [Halospina sp. K52047b]|uniref:DUF1631 domain-containing protein n=1 Tax=Halospina sp. K52047b TaxID=2614160 RepID=UPI00124A93FE|nr:DUF1631 domain-containing protein [Halospina sp. K52047b]KAA8978013.1 DUF1631 domain-containing protein [Halospina sp. K52047b]